jgi:hypothetical protein
VAPESRDVRLAQFLRAWRENTWPDRTLTQAQLAAAFSTERRVGAATVSTWESASNPKRPSAERLDQYARFFATRRSLDQGPGLIAERELTEPEHDDYVRLRDELRALLESDESDDETSGEDFGGGPSELRAGSFTFAEGPVTIICPAAPDEERGEMAREGNPNFTKLLQYTDQDALVEMFGHVRAANPSLDVFHRIASEAKSDDISTHVILLGGVAWNRTTRRILGAIDDVPITQIDTPGQTRDAFSVKMKGSEKAFRPQWEDYGETRELTEDVGLLLRLPHPFNLRRTLTICNGIYSRGVLGAVRCLTDKQVRDANEEYLADRFPDGRFALLLRIPVVSDQTISPDLQNSDSRLFEWPPQESAHA